MQPQPQHQYRIRDYKLGSKRDQFRQKFGQLIEHYETFKNATAGLCHTSINNYSDILPEFFLYLNETPNQTITNRIEDYKSLDIIRANNYERKVKQYLKNKKDQGLSIASIASPIRGFFSNNSHLLQLHLGRFKISKTRKHKKYSPTQQEVNKLYNYAKTTQNKLLIALAYQNGLVPQDLANLKIGEYPTEPWQCYRKIRQKSGSPWYGVSTPEICQHMENHLKKRDGNTGEPLFLNYHKKPLNAISIRQRIKKIINQAGYNTIPQFTPKCLRDGFADALLDIELYIFVEEAMMGHALGLEHQYGSEHKLIQRVTRTMHKLYPFIQLTQEPKTKKKPPKTWYKTYNQNYYKKHREEILEKRKQQYATINKEKQRAYSIQYYHEHKDRIHMVSTNYRERNREKINQHAREKYKEKQKTKQLYNTTTHT